MAEMMIDSDQLDEAEAFLVERKADFEYSAGVRQTLGHICLLRGDAEKAKPGLKGNLIANGFQKRTATSKEGKTREYRTFLGPLPAIPFEVVER